MDDDLESGDADGGAPEWAFHPPVAHYGPMQRGPFRFIVLGLFGLYVVFDLLQQQSYVRSALAVAVLAGLAAFEIYARGLSTIDVHDEGIVVRTRHERSAISWDDIVTIGHTDGTTHLGRRDGRELAFAVEGFGPDEADELRRHVEHRRATPDEPRPWLG